MIIDEASECLMGFKYLYCSMADFVCNHGLTQLVGAPTRGDSMLDVILCSDLLSCDDVTILPPLLTVTVIFCHLNYSRPCLSLLTFAIKVVSLTFPKLIRLVCVTTFPL